MKKYKKAESQGAYIDRLRTKYPFRIHTDGYDAYLVGVQPLQCQDIPIYRFPGGVKIVDVTDIKKVNVVEW